MPRLTELNPTATMNIGIGQYMLLNSLFERKGHAVTAGGYSGAWAVGNSLFQGYRDIELLQRAWTEGNVKDGLAATVSLAADGLMMYGGSLAMRKLYLPSSMALNLGGAVRIFTEAIQPTRPTHSP